MALLQRRTPAPPGRRPREASRQVRPPAGRDPPEKTITTPLGGVSSGCTSVLTSAASALRVVCTCASRWNTSATSATRPTLHPPPDTALSIRATITTPQSHRATEPQSQSQHWLVLCCVLLWATAQGDRFPEKWPPWMLKRPTFASQPAPLTLALSTLEAQVGQAVQAR